MYLFCVLHLGYNLQIMATVSINGDVDKKCPADSKGYEEEDSGEEGMGGCPMGRHGNKEPKDNGMPGSYGKYLKVK